jgi:hypothetical protein
MFVAWLMGARFDLAWQELKGGIRFSEPEAIHSEL